jgi:hypothetical protein
MYNILMEFGIPMKTFRLIKTCLSETYIKSVKENICLILLYPFFN